MPEFNGQNKKTNQRVGLVDDAEEVNFAPQFTFPIEKSSDKTGNLVSDTNAPPGGVISAEDLIDGFFNVDDHVMEAVSVATGEFIQNLPHVDDEIDDARALDASRRRRVSLRGRGDPVKTRNVLEEIVDRTVPVVIHPQAVTRVGANGVPLVDPRWIPVDQLPGYLKNIIRALGRTIFKMFPCFNDVHSVECSKRGEDPLGSVGVLASLAGGGPSNMAELNFMATHIAANGKTIDFTELSFNHHPTYKPDVILSCDEDNTYLMVRESVDAGAPFNSMYIYTWSGGMKYYRENQNKIDSKFAPVLVDEDRPKLGF